MKTKSSIRSSGALPAEHLSRPDRLIIRIGVLLACAASAIFNSACAPLSRNQAPNFVEIIDQTSKAVVAIADEKGFHGTGFRLADSRFIVTAAHVTSALQDRAFVSWNAKRWKVHPVRSDTDTDLSLLELDEDAPMPGLRLSGTGQATKVGEWIIVLGCPFGTLPTATVGIVSAEPGAVLVPANLKGLMQLNAAVNPGNSGGPVLNLEGQVIGVANATIPGGFGLGFAIPASALENLLAVKQPVQ